MNALSPLLLPAVCGWLTAYYLFREVSVRYKKLLLCALALPLGFSGTSLIMFWSYATNEVRQNDVAIALNYALLFFLLIPFARFDYQVELGKLFNYFRRAKIHELDELKKCIEANLFSVSLGIATFILFAASLGYFLNYFIQRSCENPIGGWDARYLWNTKALFYFRTPKYWANMFAPVISSSILPDYPHLLPGTVAWGWNWLHSEMLIWPITVSFVFSLSTCFMILWYLANRAALWVGFLAASFFLMVPCYQFWSTTQYADIPLCFFITAGVLLLTTAMQEKNNRILLVSGLLTGCAFWTKNEGILFTAWIILVASLLLAFKKREQKKDKVRAFTFFIAGLLLPLLTTIYLKMMYGGGGIYLGSTRSAGEYVKLLANFDRTKFVTGCFLIYKTTFSQWKGLWILFYLAIILGGKQTIKNYRWIIALMVILMDLGYFLVFHITPLEIKFHIQTSLLRLLQHHGALALIFAVEVATSEFLRHNKTHTQFTSS